MKIDDVEVTVELLVEEKESEYLKKVAQDQLAKRKGGNAKGKGGRGNRGNNNKNHGGHKRKRDDGEDGKAADEEPPVKKVESKPESTASSEAKAD